jgi:hypothetical protein
MVDYLPRRGIFLPMRRSFSMLSVLPVLVVLSAGAAMAQATRTWVSGVGDDVNPCSRTAPCKTFAGAISKTASGGEINTLDPGGFGAVTITKPITISNEGTGESGVLVGGTNGIVIELQPPGGVVTLRGLIIDGVGSGLSGITFLSGSSPGTLNIERCQIFQFIGNGTAGSGINFQPSGAATLNVIDTRIYNNTGSAPTAILIQPQSGGSVTGFLDGVKVYSNIGDGIKIDGSAAGAGATNVTITNSTISNNTAMGIQVSSPTASTNVTITNTSSSQNGTFGVRSQLAASMVLLSNSTIGGNGTGIGFSGGGQLISFGNNNLGGNATDGTPSSTVTTK